MDIVDIVNDILHLFTNGIAQAFLVSIAFWKSDDFISEAGAVVIFGAITQTTSEPSKSEISKYVQDFLGRYFDPLQIGFLRFTKNVAVLTICSMLVLLTIYVYKTPGMSGQIGTEMFLSQFFGNGFVVTFLVNFFVFLSYPFVFKWITLGTLGKSILVLAADVLAKAILFCFFTVLTYITFALTRGSFQGDVALAIRVVPDTLEFAIKWKSVTAVYLYSVIISSFPIFVVVLIQMMASFPKFSRFIRNVLFWLPFESKPLRAIVATFAIFVVIFCTAVSLVVSFI